MQVSSTGATPPVETKVIKIDPENFADAQLSYPVELIKRGEVVAFPTETVYGLGANALRLLCFIQHQELSPSIIKV